MSWSRSIIYTVCVRLRECVCMCVSLQASLQLLREGVGPRRAEISFSAC